MAVTEEHVQAIGIALQALVTNASNMTAESINQITQQILFAPKESIAVMTNAQLDQYDGNAGGLNRRRSRAIAARKKSDKARKDRVKLRPLNGFICFRSYYGPIFSGLTQMIKSGLIRQLWANDSWKSFWSIEAKAYSEIRDAHINQVTLDKFLTETVGLLGVIPADEYLLTMGWKLVIDGPTEYRLLKVDPTDTMKDTPLSTNLSVADIVKHCYAIGLVKRPAQPRPNISAAGDAMAFATQPWTPKIPIVVQETQTASPFTDEYGFFNKMTAQSEINAGAIDGDQAMTDNNDNIVNGEAMTTPYGENLSIETATADVQKALEDYPDEYPFAHHFHPAVDRPILAFDPTVIQDNFDPYDLNDYINLVDEE